MNAVYWSVYYAGHSITYACVIGRSFGVRPATVYHQAVTSQLDAEHQRQPSGACSQVVSRLLDRWTSCIIVGEASLSVGKASSALYIAKISVLLWYVQSVVSAAGPCSNLRPTAGPYIYRQTSRPKTLRV